MAVSPTSPDFFSQMRQKYPIVARGKVREVTFEDGQKLLAAVHHASPLLEMRDKILFWIMLQHGVRATEALKLNIDDVRLDTDTKTIVIPSIVRLHREAGDRVIDVSAIAELLGPYVKQIAAVSANGWLFPNKSGTCMSIRSVRRFFTRAARKAGLPTNMHLCVQNYIIQSLRRGVEMRDLQRELGLLQITAIRQYAGCAQAPSALQGATAG
jgi:site-specific recombinase XerD